MGEIKVGDTVQVSIKNNVHYGMFGVVEVIREGKYGVSLDDGCREWYYEVELIHCTENSKQDESFTVINSGEELKVDDNPTPGYYNYEYKGLKLDPYRITEIYGITNPAQQHAVKKLLRAGNKPGNETVQEIDEVIKSLVRWKEMIKEDQK